MAQQRGYIRALLCASEFGVFRTGRTTVFPETHEANVAHLPKKRCVKVAMKLISITSPTMASAAASTVTGSPGMTVLGRKPRPWNELMLSESAPGSGVLLRARVDDSASVFQMSRKFGADLPELARLIERRRTELVPVRGCFGRWVEREDRRTGVRAKRARLRGPIEVAERPREPLKVVLRRVVVSVDRTQGRNCAMRRSISAIACPICALRRSLVVAASWRSSSVRASLNDSSARTRSGSRTAPACFDERSRSSSSMRS